MSLSEASAVRLGDELVHRVYLGTDLVHRGRIPILVDDFSGDLSKWHVWGGSHITDGRLYIPGDANYNSGVLTSIDTPTPVADFAASAEVVFAPSEGGYTDTYLGLDFYPRSAGKIAVGWDIEGATLTAGETINDTYIGRHSTAFDASTRWLRISVIAGIISWETSPDGVNWLPQHSRPASFPVSSVIPSLGTGGHDGMEAAQFDNFRWERLG